MIWSGKRAFLVMIGLSLALSGVATEAEGGWLIRNPYVEGHRVINRPRLIGSTATAGHVHCDGCTATSCGEAYKKPKMTTATLRLWIAEDATWISRGVTKVEIEINGQPVDRQYSAGSRQGWQEYTLDGLTRGQPATRVIKAIYTHNPYGKETSRTTRFTLAAGGEKELYLIPDGFRE